MGSWNKTKQKILYTKYIFYNVYLTLYFINVGLRIMSLLCGSFKRKLMVYVLLLTAVTIENGVDFAAGKEW